MQLTAQVLSFVNRNRPQWLPTMSSRNAQIQIRPIRRGDTQAIYDMHARLSAESMQFRYLGGSIPPKSHFDFICERAVGYVAVVGRAVVGMAYYVVEAGNSAEVAFLVEDAFHGKGIGSRLFTELLKSAEANKLSTLTAFVEQENRGMMRLFEKSGLPFAQRYRHGTREVTLHVKDEQPATELQGLDAIFEHLKFDLALAF